MSNVPGSKVVLIQLDSVTDGKPTAEQLEFMTNLYRAQMGRRSFTTYAQRFKRKKQNRDF